MDGDYHYVVDGSCRLFDARHAGRCNRVHTVLLAVMVSLPRDSVHFRGGTIQLFVSEENEYSKGRRVLYSCVRINYWDQRKKVP